MSVWFAIPSKRPPEEAEPVLKQWRERGYKLAVWRDQGEASVNADAEFSGTYTGYARIVNLLVDRVLALDPEADWIVTGGDDVLPDPNHSAEEIARQCGEHFGLLHDVPNHECSTFGVMQPIGDRWGDKLGPYVERVCGSPWMGREFCKRVNRGTGPLWQGMTIGEKVWEGYTHMGVDEELQAVASKYGILLQRPDLTHFHQHWGRPKPGEALGQRDRMPKFLEHANSRPEWDRYKKLFADRQAAGFPGSELL